MPEDSLHPVTMFSIMHISDLHRSPSDPISNVTLIESLLADSEKHHHHGIPRPDAVVVSGDIIWGANLGDSNFRNSIREQYDVAIEFLVDLTDRFLNGDRSRLIIAPGNHDCCWNTAKSAMRPIARHQEPRNIEARLHDNQANIRWSWQDRCFYEITDLGTYRSRFDAYWDCVEQFYEPVDFQIPLCRSRGFNVFTLDDDQITVVAFESPHQNDHLSDHGHVPHESISQSAVLLRDNGLQAPLKIAVWHHGIAGPPMASDYLDVASVLQMAGAGFRLGLHGHQHHADINTQYIHLPETEAIAVVGAGSLCAGERHLPHGVKRQYNIVVIDDNYCEARIHVREIIEANRFGASRNSRFVPDGSFKVRWEPTRDAAGRPIDYKAAKEREVIFDAERSLKGGCALAAMEALANLDLSCDPYARKLFSEAARAAGRFACIVEVMDPPKDAAELVELVQAHQELKNLEVGLRTLEQYQAELSLAPAVFEQLQRTLHFHLSLEGSTNER